MKWLAFIALIGCTAQPGSNVEYPTTAGLAPLCLFGCIVRTGTVTTEVNDNPSLSALTQGDVSTADSLSGGTRGGNTLQGGN